MTWVLYMKVLCLWYQRSCDFHVISVTYMHFGRSRGWAMPWSSKYRSRALRSLHEARGSQVVSLSIHLTSSLSSFGFNQQCKVFTLYWFLTNHQENLNQMYYQWCSLNDRYEVIVKVYSCLSKTMVTRRCVTITILIVHIWIQSFNKIYKIYIISKVKVYMLCIGGCL